MSINNRHHLRLTLSKLVFGENNKYFDEVLKACWETFQSPNFRLGRDRMGIGLALYNKTVDEHYQSLLSWARHSTDANYFLERISRERLSSGYQRNFIKLIRDKLTIYSNGLLSDDDLWNFLRSLVILRFDFHVAGSADYHYTVELLRAALPAEQKLRAEDIFGKLDKYAGEAVPTAGSFNLERLKDRLLAEGIWLFCFCREMPQDIVVINQQSSVRASECKFSSSNC